MLAIPGWGTLQRRFLERAEARLAGRALPALAPGARARRARPGLRAWGRLGRTLARTLLARALGSQPEVVIITLAGPAAAARDAYFGELAAWLGAGRAFTVYLASGTRARLPADGQRAPLEAFATVGDALAAWTEGRDARLEAAPGQPEQAALAAELARAEVASGEAFMHAFVRRAFARLLGATRPKVLVYPFENRAWEKSLVTAARAAGVGRVVGYQHSSITPRHLAFERTADSPLPDCIVTVGTVTMQWLREHAPALGERLVEGASLRRAAAPPPLPSGHGLLVAISSSRNEAQALIALVHAAARAVKVPVVIRSHPTIPAADLFARFEWPPHVRLSQGTALAQDLGAASIVAYSSSTVALEGMLGGRLPLFVDIGDLPAADPLIGPCPVKRVVEDADGLAAAVAEIAGASDTDLEARRAIARRYAEAYLQAPDAARRRAVTATILGAAAGDASLRLTAVIPTKNRPEDLERAVASIRAQTRLPDTLLIVDQSADDAARQRVEALLASPGPSLRLDYVLDSSIQGLVEAKRFAARRASSDLVCFLEDDEVLEAGFLEAIERGFHDRPDMLGCSGLVTNLPPLPAGYIRLFHLFHRGIFRDARVGVHGHVRGASLPLIPSNCLSGGLSCWRREVLKAIPFDVANGFHMLEDIDFSTRAAARFGARFFINPNARLEHRLSPVNREVLGPRERRKMREYVLYYRKRSGEPGATWQLGWLLWGLLLEALWQSARAMSAAPLAGYFAGIADGARAELKAPAP